MKLREVMREQYTDPTIGKRTVLFLLDEWEAWYTKREKQLHENNLEITWLAFFAGAEKMRELLEETRACNADIKLRWRAETDETEAEIDAATINSYEEFEAAMQRARRELTAQSILAERAEQ